MISQTLQKHLQQLRECRMTNYSNTSYQKRSGDTFFRCVPEKLWERWYSSEKISFYSLYNDKEYELDSESIRTLLTYICTECYLILVLYGIFYHLPQKKKVGK